MKNKVSFILSALLILISCSGCSAPNYTITWKNADGTILEIDENVPMGTIPTYNGETPTKANDEQFTYSFYGWSPLVQPAHEDQTYIAIFESRLNRFTVTWQGYDGTVLEIDNNVPYGATPEYNGITPTKPETSTFTYIFSGWSPALSSVTNDITFYAQFDEISKLFIITFNSNGGVGGPTQQIKTRNEPLLLSDDVPTKDYHIFCGWNCFESNLTFKPGDPFDIDQDITLYAMWVECCHFCNGSGHIDKEEPCNVCLGEGIVTTSTETTETCSNCSGTGEIITTNTKKCSLCGGVGKKYVYSCSACLRLWYYSPGGRNCPYCYSRGTVTSEYVGPCEQCWGSGTQTTTSSSTCTMCNGTGEITVTTTNTTTCEKCSGSGKVTVRSTCPYCFGDAIFYPDAPILLEVTCTTVILEEEDGFEYKCISKNDSNHPVDFDYWQKTGIFEDLQDNTQYSFYKRRATTPTSTFGVSSKALTIRTERL